MADVTVTLANPHVLRLLKKDLQDLGREFAGERNLRKPFERIRDEVLIPSIRQNFEVGGRPKRWEPLSPTTIMNRGGFGGSLAEAGFAVGDTTPLNHTGQLKRAATAKARFTIRQNTMTFGDWPNRRWFGPVHDLKALADKAQIPHRPFVLIQQPEDANHIQEIMIEWVEDMVNKHVRRRYV